MISGISIGKKYRRTGKALQKVRLTLHQLGYLAQAKKGKRSYEVLKPLPETRSLLWNEYCKQFYTGDLGTFVEDAKSELEELGYEMEEWSSNLEDSALMYTYKAEQVYDCYQLLQDQVLLLGDLETPESLTSRTLMVIIPYDVALLQGRSRNIGRWKRMSNALTTLERIMVMRTDDMLEDEEAWMVALGKIIDELQDIEFPGAYD